MTSVVPDLPVPGAAARKPQTESLSGNQTIGKPASGGENTFAVTLEGVTAETDSGAAGAMPVGQNGGTQAADLTVPINGTPAIRAATLDAASAAVLATGTNTGLQGPTNSGLSPDLMDVAGIVATIAGGLETGADPAIAGTASLTNPAVAAPPAVAAIGPNAGASAPLATDRTNRKQSNEATDAAPTPTAGLPTPPLLVPPGSNADPALQIELAAGTDSGLHIPGVTAATPHSAIQGAPNHQGLASPQPVAPSNALAHANAASQVAAGLGVDPMGLATANPDRDAQSGPQREGKPTLPTAVLPTSLDAKPADGTASQTFTATLAATSANDSPQSTREAAASTQRPQRPAQAAPAAAQIAVHIVRAMADGVSRFTVQLQPAELGRVEVKMEIGRDGTVRANVTADRQETVDQLSRDSRVLERALQDAGLKADSQNLHFSLRGGQNGRDLSENRTSSNSSGTGNADTKEVSEAAMHSHWSTVAGSTGALDIRV